MNTDRFLTRVWDKEEKKMLYPGDKLPKSFFPEYENVRLVAISNIGLIVSVYAGNVKISYPLATYAYIEFGDRFIPMQCTAYKDDNKKLIYQEDIINIEGVNFDGKLNYWVRFYEEEDCHIANFISPSDSAWDYILLHSLLEHAKDVKIIGNKWEHSALLEENKDDT